MIFCNLGSGSKGNSTYIQSEKGAILVDQGFSGREIVSRLTQAGLSPKNVAGIILTHEHSDHLRGVGTFARKYDVPVYLTERTFHSISPNFLKKVKVHFFNTGNLFFVEDIAIKAFYLPHDAADPVGIVASDNFIKIGIVTDLGYVAQSVLQHISDTDLLLLEANHDISMLVNGPYPLNLIQRIKGRMGHLSNDQSIDFLKRIPNNSKLKHLVLGHLSEINNTPEIVRKLFEEDRANNSKSYKINLTSQYHPGDIISLL
jgi:phosphoribosyl 1,2-cyclic phosphodiesterase